MQAIGSNYQAVLKMDEKKEKEADVGQKLYSLFSPTQV